MADTILVTYASRYGSTEGVAEAIGQALKAKGRQAEVRQLKDVQSLAKYGPVILGAPLSMFHWHKDAMRFLNQQKSNLEKRPLAIFCLGPIKSPHDAIEWQNSNDHLNKELDKFPWLKPMAVQMFGGAYAPEKLGFPLKLFVGKEPPSDIRDWAAIRAWSGQLADSFK